MSQEIDFKTPVAQGKLDSLLDQGFTKVGYALAKDNQRAWIDRWGMVLWPKMEQEASTALLKALEAQGKLCELADQMADSAMPEMLEKAARLRIIAKELR